jgi:hypothetical protein
VETALLAAQCADQVVLVVRPGWARRRQVRSAVAVLAQQHAPVTLSVLTRSLRGGAGRAAGAELPPPPAPLAESEALDAVPPAVGPLPSDPAPDEKATSTGEAVADEASRDDAPPDADTQADPVPEPEAEDEAVVEGAVEDLDAELDGELDAELDAELDEDGPVLSGGGPARGGDA